VASQTAEGAFGGTKKAWVTGKGVFVQVIRNASGTL